MFVLNELVREVSLKGPLLFIKELKEQKLHPIVIFQCLSIQIPIGLRMATPDQQWSFLEDYLFSSIYQRQPIPSLSSTRADGKELIRRSSNIIVVCGAGISVGAGIPDFRSPDTGLYTSITSKHPQLPEPESLFDLEYFRNDPLPFYNFMRDNLLSSKVRQPTLCHFFIKNLEEQGKLLRLYTQNIDSLESNIKNVVYCHGSPKTFSCIDCHSTMHNDYEASITDEIVPTCPICCGLVKPDITFFNEAIKEGYNEAIYEDILKADLLLVIGTSMEVHPVSTIPDMLPPAVPQMLINKMPLVDHNYDVVLLGDCQEIVKYL